MNILFIKFCDDAMFTCLLIVDSVRIYERIDNSKARGENLNVVYSLVIQPAYL